MKLTKKQDVNIIMGDFNAKIGRGRSSPTVGDFDLGVRNERGDRLVQFCRLFAVNLVVTNTFFRLREDYT